MTASAVFLDRDGTIIEDVGYIAKPADVRLLPHAPTAIRRFNQAGRLVVIVSNQSGVARGLFDEKVMMAVHRRVVEDLEKEGCRIDGAYYCPFLNGEHATVARYRRDSALRKPKPGMLLLAADELDIDLAQSWMIGDSARDAEAGRRAGCKTILIAKNGDLGANGPLLEAGAPSTEPLTARNLQEAADMMEAR